MTERERLLATLCEAIISARYQSCLGCGRRLEDCNDCPAGTSDHLDKDLLHSAIMAVMKGDHAAIALLAQERPGEGKKREWHHPVDGSVLRWTEPSTTEGEQHAHELLPFMLGIFEDFEHRLTGGSASRSDEGHRIREDHAERVLALLARPQEQPTIESEIEAESYMRTDGDYLRLHCPCGKVHDIGEPQEQGESVKFGPMFNIEWPEPSVWVPGKWNDFHIRALGVASVVRSALRGDTKIGVEAFAALDSLMGKAIDAGNLTEPKQGERIEGWANKHMTRDNNCSCEKAATWEFHADCGHIETQQRATLILHPKEPKEN